MSEPTDTVRTEPAPEVQPTAPSTIVDDGGRGHAAPPAAPPRLADGVELLGRFEDSGYKEPPYMARRGDGQMIQLPPLLYLVAERLDGQRGYEQIAAEVSEAVGRGLDPDDARMLVEEKLHPLGIATGPDGSSPEVRKADPFLALKMKKALVPPGAVRAVTTIFRPLFWPVVILAVLAGMVAFDFWFFFVHGIAESMRQMLYQPLFMLLTFGFIVVAAAFHEIGHATGCRYGGARPGAMGAGIYIVWPAFYTDVTDSYRLRKGGRLRTDLGGVYFNSIFILAVGGIALATGIQPLLIPVFLAHLEIFRQLLPLLRLDGYYVLSDLTGVPDLFGRLKPILVSLVPGKKPDKRVTQLKPWVRAVVSIWVLVFVPFLVANVAYILIFAPRIFSTGWDSFASHLDSTAAAFDRGAAAAGAAGVVQLIALALPAIGIAYGFGRSGTRLTGAMWTKTRGRPMSRAGGLLLMAGAIAAVAVFWWPDGDYTPIRPGERWTVQDAALAASSAASSGTSFPDTARDTNVERDPSSPETGTDPGSDGLDGLIEPTPTPTSVDASLQPSPTTSTTASPSPTVSPSPSRSPTSSPSPQPTPTTEVSP